MATSLRTASRREFLIIFRISETFCDKPPTQVYVSSPHNLWYIFLSFSGLFKLWRTSASPMAMVSSQGRGFATRLSSAADESVEGNLPFANYRW